MSVFIYSRLISIILTVFLLNFNNLLAQDYQIKLWGIPVGYAKINSASNNELSLNLKSNNLIDLVFPVELNFFSRFNDKNFSIIENKKTTLQGNNKQKYTAKLMNKSKLIYDTKDTILVEPNTLSLLSFLKKIKQTPGTDIDGRWVNLENEGSNYRARLLWNDTTTVKLNSESVLCDHYRVDINLLNDKNQIFDKTDYFNELFFDINSIRQIWVERWQKQPKIVKISIKNNQKDLLLVLKD